MCHSAMDSWQRAFLGDEYLAVCVAWHASLGVDMGPSTCDSCLACVAWRVSLDVGCLIWLAWCASLGVGLGCLAWDSWGCALFGICICSFVGGGL